MSKTIDEIYSSIGNGIHSCIDSRYDEASITALISEGYVELRGIFHLNGEKKYFRTSREATTDFKELQKIMKTNHHPAWNTACFTLKANGEFSIDFKWDQALADEIEQLSKE